MGTGKFAIGQAKAVARRVWDGTLAPGEGCAAIAALCMANDWPTELTSFVALAHEQDRHEEFGFDRENTAPLIVEECRLLLGAAQ
jgi:hypothetical protein